MAGPASMGTALVVGDASRACEAACTALEAEGWRVVRAPASCADVDRAAESSTAGELAAAAFAALRAGAAPRRVVIVGGEAGDAPLLSLAPSRFRELESRLLVAPWLALRAAAAELHEAADAVLVVADVAGCAGARGAFASAAQRALRTMVAAAAVEFASRPEPLRVNLLEYDASHLDPVAFARALAFMVAPASGFMTGTPLSLPAATQVRG